MIDQQKIKEVFGEDACFAFWQHSRQTYRDLKLSRDVIDEIGFGVRRQ